MEVLRSHPLLAAVFALSAGVFLWLWKLNRALQATPPEALATSPHRWTDAEMAETYRRIEGRPIEWAAHLPPKLDRRYVVVGGSGGVGGQLILQLLERGQPPAGVRNVDFRAPTRPDLCRGAARDVAFVPADITDAASVEAAFAQPWPAAVAHLPLTVFHTAALIIPHERSLAKFGPIRRVNVDGTQHVLDAARRAGADVLVSTSSASVALRPVRYFGAPWRAWPKGYVQVLDEADFDRPLRPHAEFFGNYAYSKALAERLVCGADAPGFRTGAVRPANGVYGTSHGDQLVGLCLRAGGFPSWIPHVVQNLVHAGHVGLGHLLFEAALLRPSDDGGPPACAGRPFVVTDPNPPPTFGDLYRLLAATARTPCRVSFLPPVPMLLLAYVVEGLDAAASRLLLLPGLRPRGDFAKLQPAIFSVQTHTPASDAAARRPVADGGLGFRGVCTTLEGVCQQVADWNRDHESEWKEMKKRSSPSPADVAVDAVRNLGTVPATAKA